MEMKSPFQNGSRRCIEALNFLKFEPRYLGSYEVLKKPLMK